MQQADQGKASKQERDHPDAHSVFIAFRHLISPILRTARLPYLCGRAKRNPDRVS
jgi:hypothetical protein